jgi:hypothetical protein
MAVSAGTFLSLFVIQCPLVFVVQMMADSTPLFFHDLHMFFMRKDDRRTLEFPKDILMPQYIQFFLSPTITKRDHQSHHEEYP